MAYFNNSNAANFYPTSSMSFGEFDTHLTRISATEPVENEHPHTFANGRSMGRQLGEADGPSTSLRAEGNSGKHDFVLLGDRGLTCTSPEPASSVTSHTAQTHGYDQLPHPGQYLRQHGGFRSLCRDPHSK